MPGKENFNKIIKKFIYYLNYLIEQKDRVSLFNAKKTLLSAGRKYQKADENSKKLIKTQVIKILERIITETEEKIKKEKKIIEEIKKEIVELG